MLVKRTRKLFFRTAQSAENTTLKCETPPALRRSGVCGRGANGRYEVAGGAAGVLAVIAAWRAALLCPSAVALADIV